MKEVASDSPNAPSVAPVMTRSAAHPYSILGLLWIAYLINYVDRQMAFSWFPALRRTPDSVTRSLA